MLLFTDADIQIMNSMHAMPDSQITYDGMRDCLGWTDEMPSNVTSSGYNSYIDLVIARALLFQHPQIRQRYPKINLVVFPDESIEEYQKIWMMGMQLVPKYVGMSRTLLSEQDIDYFLSRRQHPF